MHYLKALSVALIICGGLEAKPSGMQAVHGQAKYSERGGEFVIESSDKAILHFDAFHIGKEETVRFLQNHSSSSVLSRVEGKESSQILGSLLSNGQVYLINPNGVFIGPQAKVLCSGFIGSAFDLLNEDFLSGKELHFFGDHDGSVINEGMIDSEEGPAVLIGASVDNQGSLVARRGFAGVGSGKSVIYRPGPTPHIYVVASKEKSYVAAINRALSKFPPRAT